MWLCNSLAVNASLSSWSTSRSFFVFLFPKRMGLGLGSCVVSNQKGKAASVNFFVSFFPPPFHFPPIETKPLLNYFPMTHVTYSLKLLMSVISLQNCLLFFLPFSFLLLFAYFNFVWVRERLLLCVRMKLWLPSFTLIFCNSFYSNFTLIILLIYLTCSTTAAIAATAATAATTATISSFATGTTIKVQHIFSAVFILFMSGLFYILCRESLSFFSYSTDFFLINYGFSSLLFSTLLLLLFLKQLWTIIFFHLS